eukprot:CAMPEP_0168325408 /NCGR_PEP_ID=MMETSP0213-20121227/4675_1 /TAXON_ID=151035 /ORGANISM="Euplotes harpa, Strain FSP1.4" /LENGTH=126 /DNA_ID=CAMNT_0008327897 /DNA_START=34 /DNA_END=414 /DNA_ORIENTATION=+
MGEGVTPGDGNLVTADKVRAVLEVVRATEDRLAEVRVVVQPQEEIYGEEVTVRMDMWGRSWEEISEEAKGRRVEEVAWWVKDKASFENVRSEMSKVDLEVEKVEVIVEQDFEEFQIFEFPEVILKK